MADQEQKLISATNAAFAEAKYAECKTQLCKLAEARPNDWKILMNTAVADFYDSGQNELDRLQSSITSVCSQMNVDIDESKVPEDSELAVIYYNQAVMHVMKNDHEAALSSLDKIFSLIQVMEDWLCQKVCELILQLSWTLKKYDKVLSYVGQIESSLMSPKLSGSLGIKEDSRQKQEGFSSKGFKLTILSYKVKSLLALKRFEECCNDFALIEELDSSNFVHLTLKSTMFFEKHDYKQALELYYKFQEDLDKFDSLTDAQKFIFYNSASILNHHLGKVHCSCFFMEKAVEVFERARLNKSDSFFNSTRLLKLLYNRGVALLFGRKPEKAFDCFLDAAQGFQTSPFLWLRLAECCVSIYRSTNEDFFNFTEMRKNLVETIYEGDGIKNILLNDKIYKDSAYSSEPQSYAVPMATLEFATICARNSLVLLSGKSNCLKWAILAINAYIRLTIGDPVLSLKYSNQLLRETQLPPLYKYLGKLYKAESLVLLDKLEEAIQILDPNTFKDCDPSQDASKNEWVPSSVTASQSVILYNLASVLVMKKDFSKASELLKYVWVSRGPDGQVPVHVIALAVYIELCNGRSDVARSIIKQHCFHLFPQTA